MKYYFHNVTDEMCIWIDKNIKNSLVEYNSDLRYYEINLGDCEKSLETMFILKWGPCIDHDEIKSIETFTFMSKRVNQLRY